MNDMHVILVLAILSLLVQTISCRKQGFTVSNRLFFGETGLKSGVFQFDGSKAAHTEGGSTLKIKLKTKGTKVELSAQSQTAQWYPLQPALSLSKMGYDKWTTTSKGFIFRPAAAHQLPYIQCDSNQAEKIDNEATELLYACSKQGSATSQDAPATLSKATVANPAAVTPATQTKDVATQAVSPSTQMTTTPPVAKQSSVANSNLNFLVLGAHEQHAKNEQEAALGEFWYPTSDGIPYGYGDVWGDFNYPLYAITDDGYYGCSTGFGPSWTGSCPEGSSFYYPYEPWDYGMDYGMGVGYNNFAYNTLPMDYSSYAGYVR